MFIATASLFNLLINPPSRKSVTFCLLTVTSPFPISLPRVSKTPPLPTVPLQTFPPSRIVKWLAFTSLLLLNSALSRSSPFLPFNNRVEREIEVSHWGNVAFEEFVRARNTGTPLKGEFSRLDYYKTDPDKESSWGRLALLHSLTESLVALIDPKARDIYFRDIIGNITTSDVSREVDNLRVELNMRFPMMGGWKTEFVWG